MYCTINAASNTLTKQFCYDEKMFNSSSVTFLSFTILNVFQNKKYIKILVYSFVIDINQMDGD